MKKLILALLLVFGGSAQAQQAVVIPGTMASVWRWQDFVRLERL
jgi:hypothetical protein